VIAFNDQMWIRESSNYRLNFV